METSSVRRKFRPSPGLTVLAIVLCVLFIALGRWQWHRGNARQAEWDQFALGAGQTVDLGQRTLASVPAFQQVRLRGRFDADHQFLLDNRSHEGRPGYEVLTPLIRDGARAALVDRGWVPFSGLRDRLPGIAIPSHDEIDVTGRVADLPSPGLASGRASPDSRGTWPRVTSFPTMNELSAAYGSPLEGRIVWLDPHDPDGYVRDWHPPGIEPTRNWSYAVQWWSFAAVLSFLWVRLSFRKPQTIAEA